MSDGSSSTPATKSSSQEALVGRFSYYIHPYFLIMINKQATRPMLLAFRSSTPFITTVVSYAVFTEQFLYAVIVPVAPFALHERVRIPDGRVQYWVALLLAVYG